MYIIVYTYLVFKMLRTFELYDLTVNLKSIILYLTCNIYYKNKKISYQLKNSNKKSIIICVIPLLYDIILGKKL